MNFDKGTDFGKGVVFVLTREDLVNLAKEVGISEEAIDDKFVREISDGVDLLVKTQVQKFMREIRKAP